MGYVEGYAILLHLRVFIICVNLRSSASKNHLGSAALILTFPDLTKREYF